MLLNRFYEPLFTCLITTIVVEVIIAYLLKVKDKKDYLNIILVNIITNPLVVLFPYIIYLYHGITARYISLAIFELFAFLSEGFIYYKVLKYKRINSYVLSLILNLSSYIIGDIVNLIIY